MTDSGIPFRFKRNSKIGEAGAEQDDEYLFQSFLDIGDYEELRNPRSPKRILVGRTGSGKTALLRYLAHKEEHVIELEPENLSLSFISNNTVIRFFEDLGVKLDPFYSLLWKHVIAVELIKKRYGLTTEEKTKSWITNIVDSLKKKDGAKERALLYIKDWGDKFWIETESRIQELTTKLASELKMGMGIEIPVGQLGLKVGADLTEEQKQEIIYRGQNVMKSVQLRELADVIRFLDEDVFIDPQKPYYVTIDKLDEDWVDDSLRYRLIRALIEALKAFQKVENVKIIIALRHDLLLKVFSETAGVGLQEEKYDALILRLRWSQKQIESLLDKRIEVMVRQQYTTRPVRLRELFPEKVGRISFIDYLIQRTALRPRDAILFVNECITRSESAGQVKVQSIFAAESEYSRLRIASLLYEWKRIYPSLKSSIRLLEKTPAEFRLSSINKLLLDNVIEELAMSTEYQDTCTQACSNYLNSENASKHAVVAEFFRVFFQVGLVGLCHEGGSGWLWTQIDTPLVTLGQIKPGTKAQIHAMYHQALNTHYQTERN
ncbi:P-loop ATPase, Sll1717 family [Oxalicibacterium solurbis]|uniref:DNA repair ATPase n=1 Tax=Oxalicibacterium solurbis TaxID=69280 RepID=A0A8J3AXA3_9BURK|nr:DNA repair protein [Oxalicibacterium solurbis]GGI54905.1 hypothetical protein GCM10011430_20790 [Oxalicibacterium solurbis]